MLDGWPLYAQNRPKPRLEDCWFYHVTDLPGVGTVGDSWDLRGRIHDYTGHVDLVGRRVLDVGAASGFLTFEMEKCGAEVVSFDADGPDRLFLLPQFDDLFWKNRAEYLRQNRIVLDRLNNSYWYAHNCFQSRARMVYGTAYDIPEGLGQFDIVVIGQILVHLSDPVRAISSALLRCRDTVVITEGVMDTDQPIMGLCARAKDKNPWSWWHLSVGLYRELLTMAGFDVERISKKAYRCVSADVDIDLTTIVARRRQ
jgi:hypothetical protein